jgi:hypothetical protein
MSTITIEVPEDAARAYEAAPNEERHRIEQGLGEHLRALLRDRDSSKMASAERSEILGRLWGIWKDRDDLPDFEEIRREWDRF